MVEGSNIVGTQNTLIEQHDQTAGEERAVSVACVELGDKASGDSGTQAAAGQVSDALLQKPQVSAEVRERVVNKLFALKTDEIGMQALYERLMSYFPLRRVYADEHVLAKERGEDHLKRDEPEHVSVQQMLSRTRYNGQVRLKLADELYQVNRELFALKRMIDCEGLPEPPSEATEEPSTETDR